MAEQSSISTETDADIFCSVLSREAGEPLCATAVHNEIWLLLEYDGVWREKATADNELPPAVQAWLDEQAALYGGRAQFIRQDRHRSQDYLTFFVVRASEIGPRMFQFKFEDYAALLELDVGEILADEERFAAFEHVTPQYLVCTNGKRDRCCALFGLETYHALRKLAGDVVWQTTHVGGHRFAANVVTFPDGTYYGRVHTSDAATLYRARERGEILPGLLRGRSCYEAIVQAADYYLRRETGRVAIDAFIFEGLERQQGDSYRVILGDREGEGIYQIDLRCEPAKRGLYASCGAPQKDPSIRYHLHALRKMIGG